MAQTRPRRAAVASWVLYDLANSAYLTGIVGITFPLWVTDVAHGTDADVGFTLTGTMIFLLIAAPVFGSISDQVGRRTPFLLGATVVSVTATLFLALPGLSLSLALFAVALSGFHLAQICYNALLPEVSTTQNRGRVSGLAVGVGYLGSMAAVGITIVFLKAGHYDWVFWTMAGVFLLLALPLIISVRDRSRTSGQLPPARDTLAAAMDHLSRALGTVRGHPGLRKLLVARTFFTLSVNTASVFGILYATDTVGLSVRLTQVIFLAGIAVAAPSGVVWGMVADRVGPRRTLIAALSCWVIVFALGVAIPSLGLPGILWWAVGILTGIGMAGTWVSDRPLLLLFIPRGSEAEYLGLFSMTGRLSSIIGPLMWGLVATTLGFGQPAAVVGLLVSAVIAIIVVRRVDDRTPNVPEDGTGPPAKVPVRASDSP